MKKIALLIFMLGSISISKAQSLFEGTPITIGYFGHWGIHPGMKIGTDLNLKSWQKEKEKKKITVTKTRSLFVSPELGFYSHNQNHQGLLLNVDIGYRKIKDRFGLYSAFSVGIGYMRQFNAGVTYDVQDDGSFKKKALPSRGYFLPTLNYEFGQEINQRWGWFGKFSAGAKMPYNTGVVAETYFESGLRINLNK
jgi:hypothetical protein